MNSFIATLALALVLHGRVVLSQIDTVRQLHSAPPAVAHELSTRLAGLLSKDIAQIFGTGAKRDGPDVASDALDSLILAHLNKYAPRETTMAMAALEYERLFSEADLRALVAFFTSPLGG